MILAVKSALRTGVEVKVLHIRERELGYFYKACTQISTQAALLAGFCYSGLTYLTYVDGDICEKTCAEMTYPLAVTSAMGFSMLALWQSTLASMFAPGLALRGPPGSMDMAVNQLIEEYQGAMRLFVVSVFLFMTTALLWSWTWNSWITSAVGTIMVLTTMRMTYVTIVNVADEFDVDPNYTPEYNFRDGATGGWAPPEDARSLSSQAGTRNTLADLDATQARLSKAGHARQPWYARNRTLQAFVNPLLLPTPMSLY